MDRRWLMLAIFRGVMVIMLTLLIGIVIVPPVPVGPGLNAGAALQHDMLSSLASTFQFFRKAFRILAMVGLLGWAVSLLLELHHSRTEPSEIPLQPAPPALHGLESRPEVLQLRAELHTSRERAEQSGNFEWQYAAQAALDDYLPTTLRLLAERTTPLPEAEFTAALDQIRTISLRFQQQEDDTRWQVQQRFLRERAGQETGADELKLI